MAVTERQLDRSFQGTGTYFSKYSRELGASIFLTQVGRLYYKTRIHPLVEGHFSLSQTLNQPVPTARVDFGQPQSLALSVAFQREDTDGNLGMW